MGGAMVFSFFYLILMVSLATLSTYALVVFIKLGHRGIKALDIYIDKNSLCEDEKYNMGLKKDTKDHILEDKKVEDEKEVEDKKEDEKIQED